MSDTGSGDAACWLDRVCDLCGGFIENDREHECRRPVSAGDADPARPSEG